MQFYTSEAALISPLSEYIGSGLLGGDTCIIIATSKHVEELDRRLIAAGIDVASARTSKQYITLDAAQTLARFMVNGSPDWERFAEVIGGLADETTRRGMPIRAYGEMVALLWKLGNKEAVIKLENFWNKLAKDYRFSLYCAYPELHFIMNQPDLHEIQACHNLDLHTMAA